MKPSLLLLLWLATLPGAIAQSTNPAEAPGSADPGHLLSSSCAGCHASPAAASSVTDLSSLSAAQIEDRLLGYKQGILPGTVMNRIARGYTDSEIASMALNLAGQPD